ncbi:MAG: sulfotransferase [Candidatus Omnitrophica bacterium]|nr:sulfotransferase [Candidatus Omnitrophota bacterium]MCB9722249.1 sulfotransferase [Candidatus Omnitrophota bacterium]
MRRIHIVGTGPRSGTTLMAEAMIACFDIDIHTEHEDRIFVQLPGEGDVMLTKQPMDIMVVGPLLLVDPDLHVICMVRDPRDMIVSRHGREPDKYWASLRYWRAYVPYWRKIRHHPRVICVKYEDLVTEPDEIQRRIHQRLPFLAKKASFSRYHEVARPSAKSIEAMKSVRPISPAGVGAFRKHLGRLADQIEKHGSISGELIELGYEPDHSWEEVLEGVDPEETQSVWPEFFDAGELRQRRRGVFKEMLKILMRRAGMKPDGMKARLLGRRPNG